jgi:heat-inducible transcriptional repressor
MELPNHRKMEILKAVIEDYIATAVPVGSRTIARRYMSSLSAATIRNEMADLEDMGYLTQPHTSAGRIPTDKAYRMYVDRMLEIKPLDEEQNNAVREVFFRHMDEMEQVIRKTAQIISDLTQYTSLVLAPQMRRTTLRRIQLVPINREMALVVIVTDAAVVKDAVIRIPEGMDINRLDAISRMMTERFAGHSIADVDIFLMEGLERDIRQYRRFFTDLMNAMGDSILQPDWKDLVMEGAINIFNFPEYRDIERARSFLTMLETREKLYRILARRTKMETAITIGDENEDKELKDCSVVTATYRVAGRPMGSIGVIGPTRMEYGHVVGVLDLIGRNLGELISLYIDE